jgi:glycosyltransferase involved in cell wall biosynthesis
MASRRDCVIGIDGSRARSGGAKAHLIGILNEFDVNKHRIKKICVWSFPDLLKELPNQEWLVKIPVKYADSNILIQLWWQCTRLPKLLTAMKCDVVLNLDAGTVNPFSPAVTMSRDMLSYEPGELARYDFGLFWLRLIAIKYLQIWSLKRANNAIFLSEYARKEITKFTGPLKSSALIPHGVGPSFLHQNFTVRSLKNKTKPIICTYVSNIAPYKHQVSVVRALHDLRKKGFNLELWLVGDNNDNYYGVLKKVVDDLGADWVKTVGHVDYSNLPKTLVKSDLFIFASSCENLPNTLIEAMAVGLPIACSERGPMPETLKDAGIYFDPENYCTISVAVEKLIVDQSLRRDVSVRAKGIASNYSWKKCSFSTFRNLENLVIQNLI